MTGFDDGRRPVGITVSIGEPDEFAQAFDSLSAAGSGMAFHNQHDRDAFFAAADADPSRVRFGTALEHARATNVGVWGREDLLREDCARIMKYELLNYIRRRKLPATLEQVPVEVIGDTLAFCDAFSAARAPLEAALHNLVRSLGGNAGHMERMEAQQDSVDLLDVYRNILRELEIIPRRRGFEG